MEKRNDIKVFKYGFGSAILEIIYCALVAWLLTSFEHVAPQPGVMFPVFMLLLVVFSAALSGFLIFGYPVYLVVQKEIRSAIMTMSVSLATLLIAAIIFLSSVIIFK